MRHQFIAGEKVCRRIGVPTTPWRREWITAFCVILVAGICLSQEPKEPAESPLPDDPGMGLQPTLDTPTVDAPTAEEMPSSEPEPAAEPAVIIGNDSQFTPRVEINGVQYGGRGWKVIPHATTTVNADDNIFISHANKQADIYYTFAPGLSLGWGDFRKEIREYGSFQNQFDLDLENLGEVFDTRKYFFMNYTATGTVFTKTSEQDAVDQDFSIAGQWTFTKLTVGFSSRIQTLSGPDADVGTRTKRTVTSAALNSRYDLSDKTVIEVNFTGLHYDYRTALSSTEWRNEDWLDYQMFPKTNVGFGLVLGRLDVQESAEQTYEQAMVRGIYAVTEKLRVNAQFGVEYRQIGNGGQDQVTPIFGLGATFAPFPGTSVSINGSSRTQNSAGLVDENYTLTDVQVSLRQRLFHRFYFSISGGYDNSNYKVLSGLTSPKRTDNVISMSSSVAVDLTKWASLALTYTFRESDSTDQEFGYTDNQAFIQMSLIY